MRQFLRHLSLFLLVQLCLWAVIIFLYVMQRPFNLEGNEVTVVKHNLLDQQQSPRIVLIGGSNLAFGISSPEIERRTGYHPVNMGLNIGLGLSFMLHEVEHSLKNGDVAVLSPEYENFGSLYYGTAIVLYGVLEHRPAAIRDLSWGNVLELLNKGFIIAGEILRYTVEFKGKAMRAFLEIPNNPYSRSGLNRYGDVVGHYSLPYRMEARHLAFGPSNYQITPESIDRAVKGLNDFNERCQQKGVRVFYSFPPFPEGHLEKHQQVIHPIAIALRQRLKFPILDTPEEMVFPQGDFYDGFYHLAVEGVQKRTARLIEELNERGINRKEAGAAP